MFKKMNESFKKNIKESLFIFLLFLYFLVLIWVILFHLSCYAGLDTYYLALERNYSISYRFGINRVYDFDFTSSFFWSDKLINIFLFIPMGSLLMLKVFEKKSFLKCSSIGLLTSIIFEVSEVFTRLGSFDLFDIIFNLLGTIIGYFIFRFIKNKHMYSTINYSVLILSIIFVPVVLFAIISLCLNWDMFRVFFDFRKFPYKW